MVYIFCFRAAGQDDKFKMSLVANYQLLLKSLPEQKDSSSVTKQILFTVKMKTFGKPFNGPPLRSDFYLMSQERLLLHPKISLYESLFNYAKTAGALNF